MTLIHGVQPQMRVRPAPRGRVAHSAQQQAEQAVATDALVQVPNEQQLPQLPEQPPHLQQVVPGSDAGLLESAFRAPAAPTSPEPADAQQHSGSSSSTLAAEAGRRLGAPLPAVAWAVVVMVAVIAYDRGVNNLLDRLDGASLRGSLASILAGLALVFGVKLSGGRPRDMWM
jgi:hypothetical protein